MIYGMLYDMDQLHPKFVMGTTKHFCN